MSTTEATPSDVITKPQLKGLGGWLIFVGIGIVLTPFFFLASIPQFIEVFKPQAWHNLTSPDSPFYHPMMKTLLLGETIGSAGLLIFSCYLVYLFFTKSPSFPKSWITFLWLNSILQTADLYLLSIIPVLAEESAKAVIDVVKCYGQAVIWTAYLLMSVRVRNTFVKQNDFY